MGIWSNLFDRQKVQKKPRSPLTQHPARDKTPRQYSRTEKLVLEWKYPNGDRLWGEMNKAILTAMSGGDWGQYRMVRQDQAIFLLNEGKRNKDALWHAFEVCLLDSGEYGARPGAVGEVALRLARAAQTKLGMDDATAKAVLREVADRTVSKRFPNLDLEATWQLVVQTPV